MKVRDAMSRDAETVRSSQTIQEVAARMDRQGIGYFPVCDRGRLVGIITDRDITCRLVADGRDPVVTKVHDVMSKGVACCFDDDTLEAAAQLMQQNRIRRLPVVDRQEHLVGVLSLTDLVRWVPSRLTVELLEAVSRAAPLSVTINPTAQILE
ncbi:MAG: CBS domain-containing protein [Stellaceae bacterium]